MFVLFLLITNLIFMSDESALNNKFCSIHVLLERRSQFFRHRTTELCYFVNKHQLVLYFKNDEHMEKLD